MQATNSKLYSLLLSREYLQSKRYSLLSFLLAFIIYIVLICVSVQFLSKEERLHVEPKKHAIDIKLVTKEEVAKPLKSTPVPKIIPKPISKPKTIIATPSPKKITRELIKADIIDEKPQEILSEKKLDILPLKLLEQQNTLEIRPQNSDLFAHTLNKIRNQMDANKVYPLFAKKAGIQGVVKLRFSLTQEGKLLYYEILEGKKVFHGSIKEMFERTFPMQLSNDTLPEEIIITLNIVYKLID